MAIKIIFRYLLILIQYALLKYDYDTLRYKESFEFEKCIVEQFGGVSNMKQRGDFGIDGRTREGIPIQVKRSDSISRKRNRQFLFRVTALRQKPFRKEQIGGFGGRLYYSFFVWQGCNSRGGAIEKRARC